MKVIIAGSRDITDPLLLLLALATCDFGNQITEVVCGEAPGVDTMGRRWAEERGLPIASFPADWVRYGRKSAGRIRNAQMAAYGEALIAITWGSPGTKNMIGLAKAKGLPTFVMDTLAIKRTTQRI